MTMEHHPNIAVIISTYNNSAFLRLVLEGYHQQNDTAFSIHITDYGSGDETAALIREYRANFPVPITHYWHEDRGFRNAHIYNIARQQISEPYVLLIDGGCIPLPDLTRRTAVR
jgi:glycosyltransferase involved in cell wall biosynthesis